MNVLHRRICSSPKWAAAIQERLAGWLPTAGIGTDVVEIGPGYGATTAELLRHCERLTAVELDPVLADGLERRFGPAVTVVRASGADTPLPDAAYTGVVCFTMLHHVPNAAEQDRIFAEAYRLLRPGGVFAGSDSRLSLRFRLLHVRDTMVVVDPATLPDRLRRAGFTDVAVTAEPKRPLTFRAVRPTGG